MFAERGPASEVGDDGPHHTPIEFEDVLQTLACAAMSKSGVREWRDKVSVCAGRESEVWAVGK